MFGALYFGQMEFSGVEVDETAVTPKGGGGWSHRGPVQLPPRWITRSPYLRYTKDKDDDALDA